MNMDFNFKKYSLPDVDISWSRNLGGQSGYQITQTSKKKNINHDLGSQMYSNLINFHPHLHLSLRNFRRFNW